MTNKNKRHVLVLKIFFLRKENLSYVYETSLHSFFVINLYLTVTNLNYITSGMENVEFKKIFIIILIITCQFLHFNH